MTQDNVVSLIIATVRCNMPKGAKIFNVSIDFLFDAPEMVTTVVKVLHKGHKTMVMDVEVKDMEDNLLVKAMVTLLMGK